MSITVTHTTARRREALRAVVQRLRDAVLDATSAHDRATKVACWAEYRRARARVLELVGERTEHDAS